MKKKKIIVAILICVVLAVAAVIVVPKLSGGGDTVSSSGSNSGSSKTSLSESEIKDIAASALYDKLKNSLSSKYDISQTRYSISSVKEEYGDYTVYGSYSLYDKYGNYQKRNNFSVTVTSRGSTYVSIYG